MITTSPTGGRQIFGGFAWPRPLLNFSGLKPFPPLANVGYEFATNKVFLEYHLVDGSRWKWKYLVPDYDTKVFLFFNFNVPSFTAGQPFFGGEFFNYFIRNSYPCEKIPN